MKLCKTFAPSSAAFYAFREEKVQGGHFWSVERRDEVEIRRIGMSSYPAHQASLLTNLGT